MTAQPLDHEFLGLIDLLDVPLSLHNMKRAFRHFCKRCGFDQYALANVRDGRVRALSSYPQEWVDRYTYGNYLRVDPVITMAKRSLSPFAWSVREMAGQLSQTARFAKEASAFEIRSGFTVPIRVGFGGMTMLTLASNEPDARSVSLRDTTCALTATALAHADFARLPEVVGVGIAAGLSPREATCLKWASMGKTKAETAALMGLSDKTVRFYLDQVMAKLDARNVTHAVAVAVEKRLI